MVDINEVTKIGDKYYLNTDIQKIFDVRINSVDDIEGL